MSARAGGTPADPTDLTVQEEEEEASARETDGGQAAIEILSENQLVAVIPRVAHQLKLSPERRLHHEEEDALVAKNEADDPSALDIVRDRKSLPRFQVSRFQSSPIKRELNLWQSRFACKDEPIPCSTSRPWFSNAPTVLKSRPLSKRTGKVNLSANNGNASLMTHYGYHNPKPSHTSWGSILTNFTSVKKPRPIHRKGTLAL